MFSHIKTSKENRKVVVNLTNKLNLGAENVIARIAFAKSLASGSRLNLKDLQNSGGKEYSRAVLFGEYLDVYLGLICNHYGIYKTDPDVPKYIKMHIDDGLELLSEEVNLDGFDFLVEKINKSTVYL